PARQSRAASQAVARQHGLNTGQTVFARQNPLAIAAGVFHNDVIAVGHAEVMFCHEQAFADQAEVRTALEQAFATQQRGRRLQWIEVPAAAVGLDAAVASYLFNSQLVTRADGGRVLIVPGECESTASVWAY